MRIVDHVDDGEVLPEAPMHDRRVAEAPLLLDPREALHLRHEVDGDATELVVIQPIESVFADLLEQLRNRLREAIRERLVAPEQFVERHRRLLAAHAQQARELSRQHAEELHAVVLREFLLEATQELLDLRSERGRAFAQTVEHRRQQHGKAAPQHHQPDSHARPYRHAAERPSTAVGTSRARAKGAPDRPTATAGRRGMRDVARGAA